MLWLNDYKVSKKVSRRHLSKREVIKEVMTPSAKQLESNLKLLRNKTGLPENNDEELMRTSGDQKILGIRSLMNLLKSDGTRYIPRESYISTATLK